MKFLKNLSLPEFQKNEFNYILIFFILLNYFLGFFIREISNGAGHLDLELHIWIIINDLKENYYETIKNYLSYSEATFPFFHSFQSIFNPADKNYVYCLNNTTNDSNTTDNIEEDIENLDDEHIYIPNFELELENIDS